MTTPSTPTSRRLTVAISHTLETIMLDGREYTVDPPVYCRPDKVYRVNLDAATETATITEEAS